MTSSAATCFVVSKDIAHAVIRADHNTGRDGIDCPACRRLLRNAPIGPRRPRTYDSVWVVGRHTHISEVVLDAAPNHSANINISVQRSVGDNHLRGLPGGTTRVPRDLA